MLKHGCRTGNEGSPTDKTVDPREMGDQLNRTPLAAQSGYNSATLTPTLLVGDRQYLRDLGRTAAMRLLPARLPLDMPAVFARRGLITFANPQARDRGDFIAAINQRQTIAQPRLNVVLLQ